jgi:predicted RNase H-like HicB family nuclease
MDEIIFIVEEDLEGGYTAKAVGHAIFTDGDNEAELKANVKEAVAVHFDEKDAPKMIRLHFQRDEVLANG